MIATLIVVSSILYLIMALLMGTLLSAVAMDAPDVWWGLVALIGGVLWPVSLALLILFGILSAVDYIVFR